ncbi:MAG: hypothetical protein JXB38_19730 [Anaerolineales bacterium]|nr:hypothetical protein [Anaerolineales bacterium]
MMSAEPNVKNNAMEEIIYRIACAPGTTPGTGICFAAKTSGLFRSTDSGQIWAYALDSLNLETALPALDVVLSPDFANDKMVFAGVPGGILYSFDRGETWQVVPFGSPPPVVCALVISPNYVQDGILLAGTMEDGVFRCANRGQDWHSWNFGLLDLNVLCLAISPNFAADETLFAGTESGIFCSTNGGRAWKEINLPIGYEPVISLALSPAYAQDKTLLAGTETQGLYQSTDGGKQWMRLAAAQIPTAVNQIICSPDNILILSQDEVFQSKDNGASWQQLNTGVLTLSTPTAAGVPVLAGMDNGDISSL